MEVTVLVDLERCIGCWTCSMACKMGNNLADDNYRLIVRTLGSGAGIDRPAGEYPNLKMGWIPVYQESCTRCASRLLKGEEPYCAHVCPTSAIHFGDASQPNPAFIAELERVKKKNYRIFELPAWESAKKNTLYASRK